MTLSSLGWDEFFAPSFASFFPRGFVPARVVVAHKGSFQLLSAGGEFAAECTGRFVHEAAPADFPAVGDWVAIAPRPGETRADIHAVLPRRTTFARRAAGEVAHEQIVATNVDTVLLVTALDQNYNLRRIERYLTVAWESGAQPVIVLSKSDLHPDPAAAQAEVTAIARGAPVVTLTATRGDALAALAPWLVPERTVALLGSSGVGKSTLINRILGAERQRTHAISDARGARGSHTTTHRELIVAPSGVLVIDTPGMRELQLWEVDAAALDATFGDIAALAARCKFGDCTHRAEPGCAVQAALEDGSLDFARWQSFQKLQREQDYAARRADPRLERENRQNWKKLHRAARATLRAKRGEDP